MNEPERKEEEAADTDRRQQRTIPIEPLAIAPKAYAFDGWSMVPLEPESA